MLRVVLLRRRRVRPQLLSCPLRAEVFDLRAPSSWFVRYVHRQLRRNHHLWLRCGPVLLERHVQVRELQMRWLRFRGLLRLVAHCHDQQLPSGTFARLWQLSGERFRRLYRDMRV